MELIVAWCILSCLAAPLIGRFIANGHGRSQE